MVWALVPAKLGAEAKRRLTPVLAPAERRYLVRAMLSDVLVALRAARGLGGVAVVSRDAAALSLAASLGAMALREQAARTLNEAVAEGIGACVTRGAQGVLIAMGDLPFLRPEEIERLLEALPERGAVAAPSLDGTGTNLLAVRPAGALPTRFGPDSLALHRAEAARAGLPLAICPLRSAALDVDTPEDLARATATDGWAAATREWLRSVGATSSAPEACRSRRDLPLPPWSR